MNVLENGYKELTNLITFTIDKYAKNVHWGFEDCGLLVYQKQVKETEEESLQLQFCLNGTVTCKNQETKCSNCILNKPNSCLSAVDSANVLYFTFSSNYVQQFIKENDVIIGDDDYTFDMNNSFHKNLSLCTKMRACLESIQSNTYTGFAENIFLNAQIQMLLLHSFQNIKNDEKEIFSCKFLANVESREKITQARNLLLERIGEPFTIKELSRKVAINECYLKKGFKELFGTTIFEFYQTQRMHHAKYLLQEKDLNVNEVSNLLGYSSPSHFSTAFKKSTGIKPCELLIRN
jgi:AraC family transcriptional regulator